MLGRERSSSNKNTLPSLVVGRRRVESFEIKIDSTRRRSSDKNNNNSSLITVDAYKTHARVIQLKVEPLPNIRL